MTISVCVGTYGGEEWQQLAADRAIPSTLGQEAHELLVCHDPDGTVSSARNRCAEQATGDWLVFLDADDELAPGYLDAMRGAVATSGSEYGGVLYTPAVAYVVGGARQPAKFWPVAPYEDGNWMVIGTMISRALFDEAGGFLDWGDPPGSNAYEDWALWATCQKKGASVVKVPDAIYVAHQEPTSRHRNQDELTRLSWHHEIGRALFQERYPETLEEWLPSRQALRRSRRVVRRRG